MTELVLDLAICLAIFVGTIIFLNEARRPRRPDASVVLDGDQAHIRSLEHELGLCEDAVFVPGEHWLVCSRTLPVNQAGVDWSIRREDAEAEVLRSMSVPLADTKDYTRWQTPQVAPRKRRGRPTNNFTERNARHFVPPYPPRPPDRK